MIPASPEHYHAGGGDGGGGGEGGLSFSGTAPVPNALTYYLQVGGKRISAVPGLRSPELSSAHLVSQLELGEF